MGNALKALILTNEYPPHVYGGAGVHVEFLTRELAKLIDVEVRSFGEQDAREGRCGSVASRSHDAASPQQLRPGLRRVQSAIGSAGAGHRRRRPLPHLVQPPRRDPRQADVRHPARDDHPLAGAAPPVEAASSSAAATTLGLGRADGAGDGRRRHRRLGGHARGRPARCSTSPERVRVIHNGIDLDLYRAQRLDRRAGAATGSTRPAVRAVRRADHAPEGDRPPRPGHPADRAGDVQVVLCAGAPGHAGDRRRDGGGRARGTAASRRLDRGDVSTRRGDRAVLARGRLLLPVGLRAVRDHQPRGDGVRDAGRRQRPWAASRRSSSRARPGCSCRSSTRAAGRSSPRSGCVQRDLAARINQLLADEPRRRAMGVAGRRRAVDHFGWTAIARQTVDLYESLLGR